MEASRSPTSSCGSFVLSKAGLWKLLVLVSGCATFSIYADSTLYLSPRIKTYILASYIVSWAISLLLYFSRITGLWLHCSIFNSFDYFWSWASSVNFVTSSVIMTCYFGNCDPGCNNAGFCHCAKQLTSLFLGLMTSLFYILEAQNLRMFVSVGTSDICGLFAAILFLVDAFHLRAHRPTWFNGYNSDIYRTLIVQLWRTTS
ncbi:LOW QUALITY PROTEIN: uncharacterized protein LOC144746245 [Ciona intestinalis]